MIVVQLHWPDGSPVTLDSLARGPIGAYFDTPLFWRDGSRARRFALRLAARTERPISAWVLNYTDDGQPNDAHPSYIVTIHPDGTTT